jgi:glycine cleavage system H protein
MTVFSDDLLYSREHVWVRIDGDFATIGITDYAQERMGEILSVELPGIDTEVERDEPFGTAESTEKAIIELISPVNGDVVNVNEDIDDDVGILNSDPQDMGWLIAVELKDLSELEDLLDAKEYQEFVSQERETD